jgi:hypothetical protein
LVLTLPPTFINGIFDLLINKSIIMSVILNEIVEAYGGEDLLIADGFDDAVIGICSASYRIIYSVNLCINILMDRDGMDEEEAIEYFQFNVVGAYMGEKTPIYMDDAFGYIE